MLTKCFVEAEKNDGDTAVVHSFVANETNVFVSVNFHIEISLNIEIINETLVFASKYNFFSTRI